MTNNTKAFPYRFQFSKLEKNVVVFKKFLIDLSDIDNRACFEMRLNLLKFPLGLPFRDSLENCLIFRDQLPFIILEIQ